MSERRPRPDPEHRAEPAPGAPAPSPIPSEVLFAPGQREALILHGGELYRLRQTCNGKLILTK